MSSRKPKASKHTSVKIEEYVKQEDSEDILIKKEEEQEDPSPTSPFFDPHTTVHTQNNNVAAVNKPRKVRGQGKPNSKHIIKNYGKAMCTFACSDISKPYLQDVVEGQNIDVVGFQAWIKGKREIIDSMKSIRDLLMIKRTEDKIIAAYKRTFQKISIIFIKFFSVNWIFSGKMMYKQAHVDARFKILRRVQNPKLFTYFKDFTKY